MQKKTVEDYLASIYRIHEQKDQEGVSCVDIANNLKITKASVSEAVRKLKNEGLVEAEPYSKIFLTEKGEKQAKEIIHNHRVIEYFLKETLKCELEIVHKEAHNLEHALSKSTIKKLDSFLGNPKISPYGKKIH